MLYGALRARPDRYEREDGKDTPHLQIRVVDDTGQAWRISVNVRSGDKSEVVYWVVDPLVGHPILDALASLPVGFSEQPSSSSATLDYVQAPLFDFGKGRVLPPSGSQSADDLQDLVSLYLDQCKAAGGEIVAFGAKFTENRHLPIDTTFGIPDGLHGVHDIHMNQGNGADHAPDNGVHHDGGLVLTYGGRSVGLFFAFQSQRVPTDGNGAPSASARPLSALIGHTESRPVADPDVYIPHALLDPVGDDPGKEAVAIANLADTERKLTGWTLVDRNARTTTVDASIEPGGVAVVALDGTGVQLGNSGGTLRLNNEAGEMVDSVSWSSAETRVAGRFVRLHR